MSHSEKSNWLVLSCITKIQNPFVIPSASAAYIIHVIKYLKYKHECKNLEMFRFIICLHEKK